MYIALLRGINITGRNKLAMADLRQLCTGLGWSDVRSYIQSGNLVFQSSTPPGMLESELQAAILEQFGLSIPIIIRTGDDWTSYIENNPFPRAAVDKPNWVLLTLSSQPPISGAVEGLRERATRGERIARVGDSLYIHYPQGVGRSKLTPALLDRLVGSPVTARNWRTVLKLQELSSG